MAIEYLLEHAEGKSTPASEHIRGCASCSEKAGGLRATMAVMDEWTAPEPSPYFDQRLQVRLREEQRKAPAGILGWLRRPAFAVGFAAVLLAGVALVRVAPVGRTDSQMAAVRTVSPVADLQSLDKNADLYANFDLLDDVANPDAQQQSQQVEP